MRRVITWERVLLGLCIGLAWTGMAQTPGQVTFHVTTLQKGDKYAPKHVLAIWITDSNDRFVQTLKRRAASREQYLYKWIEDSNRNDVDGITGATLANHQTHDLTWDCTDHTGALVPDGVYRINVEFTERNGQGPWTADTLSFTKGTQPLNLRFANQTYFSNMSLTYTPAVLPHDLAVVGIGPAIGHPDSVVPVTVTVANQRATQEAFGVVLSNLTAGVVLGTRTVSSLAGYASVDVVFDWNTAGLAEGIYQLGAAAGPVRDETDTADNYLASEILLRQPMHDVAIEALDLPASVALDTLFDVKLRAANPGDFTESITVTLVDERDGLDLGTQVIGSLAPYQAADVRFTWDTSGASVGSHKLVARVAPVAGEADTGNNLLARRAQVGPGFAHAAARKMMISFPGYLRATPLAGFPVPVRLGPHLPGFAYPDFASPSTGGDLRFSDSSGVRELHFEIERWDTNGTSTVWVQLPELAGSNTWVWAYWGNPSAPNLPAYTGNGATWSEGFEAVWHMATPNVPDATANHPAATAYGNTDVPGVIGGAQAFNGTGAYLDGGAGFDALTNLTVSFAFLAGNVTPEQMLVNKYLNSGDAWGMRLGAGNLVILEDIAGGDVPVYPTPVSARAWHWGVGVIEHDAGGYRQRMYVDGNLVGDGVYVAPADASWSSYGGRVAMGRRAGGDDTWRLSGYLDEVRISRTARGDDWVWACYQSQRAGSGFVSYGPVVQTAPVHDVVVDRVQPLGTAIVGDEVDVLVRVENRGNQPEDFNVSLADTTRGASVGTQAFEALGPLAAAEHVFTWTTMGAEPGPHALEATIPAVSGEVEVANNTNVAVGSIIGTGFGVAPVPARAAVGGRCGAVAMLGAMAYVGRGATLAVLDVTDPGAPLELGQVRLPGRVEDVAVSGGYAYTANGSAGVQIIDVSNRPWPVHKNSFNTAGHAYGVAVDGNRLLVADGTAGLRILDVRDPAGATLIGAYATEGPARDVVVEGSTAYVLDRFAGLWVLDITAPQSPVVLGSYRGLAHGDRVAVAGGYAYVVDGQGRLTVLDVTDPASITMPGSLLLDGIGRDVVVEGPSLFVPVSGAGLQVLSLASPDAPVPLLTFDTSGEASAVGLSGGPVGCVANGFAGVQVLNLSNPAAPGWLGAYREGARACDAVVVGDLAYVAAGGEGVRIYHLTDAVPRLAGRCGSSRNARSLAVAGDIVYIADHEYGLRVEDASDPDDPLPLATYSNSTLGVIRRVGVSGEAVVAAGPHTLALLSVTNPAAPVLADSYAVPGYVFDLAVSGDLVLAAAGSAGLLLFDLSDPARLTYLGGYHTPGIAQGVTVRGTTAYVADGRAGWLVLDVSNPAVPVLVSATATASPVADLDASGGIAFLGGDAVALRVVDVTQPLTPVAVQAFAPLTQAMRVSASGHRALVAEDDAGLTVFEADAVDLDGDGLSDAMEQRIIDADPDDDLTGLEDVLAGDDFDGDDLRNGDEQIAGTDPTDPLSRFMLADPGRGAPLTLRWGSVPGKQYAVYRTDNLLDGFELLEGGIQATPPENSYVTPPSAAAAAYYLVVVE